jgi:hypothetical protein
MLKGARDLSPCCYYALRKLLLLNADPHPHRYYKIKADRRFCKMYRRTKQQNKKQKDCFLRLIPWKVK